LTEKGRSIVPLVHQIREYGIELIEKEGGEM
jgi:hypothetical protein